MKSEKLNIEKLREQYPLAFMQLEMFIKQKIDNSLSGKELTQFADSILIYAPRTLYDFFDENQFFITIFRKAFLDEWSYQINIGKEDTIYDSRSEAEQGAFLKGFELLNQKLS